LLLFTIFLPAPLAFGVGFRSSYPCLVSLGALSGLCFFYGERLFDFPGLNTASLAFTAAAPIPTLHAVWKIHSLGEVLQVFSVVD
jgi:hypothetical protein